MFGAICGDIVGSIYEADGIKTKDFPLFDDDNCFTDDSVMTCAISDACCDYLENKDLEYFRDRCIHHMRSLGRRHINDGFGPSFRKWLLSSKNKPYNSYGNGSAMRVSPVAFIAESLNEAETLAEISSEVTHNHPLGIQGAKSVAGSIWILNNGGSKEEVKKYVEDNYYKLDFTLDEIRESYKFDVSCQGSVPQSIVSFLESDSYEDAIRNAISLGGDADTMAAIAGSMAEAYYGVPESIKNIATEYLDRDLLFSVNRFYDLLDKAKTNSELNCMLEDSMVFDNSINLYK